MTVASAARQWQACGFSTIPILPNASKRPAVRWAEFMGRIPELGEVDAWWANGQEYGVALIMGKVSGNAEMLEFEARACDADTLLKVTEACREDGVLHIWDLLQGPNGYSEHSPYGGIHLIYRISDHDVPGNTKIARRPATEQELQENPDDKIKVLSETRGEGGYVIVAPSSGLCHPSGESWLKINGEYGTVPTITWEERCGLHGAIGRILDQTQAQLQVQPNESDPPAHVASLRLDLQPRPGDDFESRVDWMDDLLLGGAGWTLAYARGNNRHWVRPGKSARDGISATTGREADRDRLYVFSTSTPFPTETPITKFGAYAILHHGGDHKTAARELARLDFGSRSPGTDIQTVTDFEFDGAIDPESSKQFTLDDLGATARLADYVNGDFVWVCEEKVYYHWTGTRWEPDREGLLTQKWQELTGALLSSPESEVAKWARKHRGGNHTSYAVKEMRSIAGVSKSRSQFDRERGALNLHNGLLDLRSNTFGPHLRDRYATRIFNASYRPEAKCPNWTAFMEAVIPDAAVRAYVQRACGYSLLGDADQRALFLVWGPSGTGKSQFLETLQHLYGTYGMTASVGTFMAATNKGPTADVHRLRGKRFVATSETADNLRFDEETVKRLTGRDTMATRALYQEEQEWTPECSIWIATNHKPKFSSDDDAIWKRSKLIPFTTRFGQDGPEEIPDYARRFLYDEADGILNWMLEGLREFLAGGLQEPEEIKDQVHQHRQEVDTVAQFFEDAVNDGKLVLGAEITMSIRSVDLYQMYGEWCRQSEERRLGRRRFTNRILSSQPSLSYSKVGGQAHICGVTRSHTLSFMGGFSLGANDRD